MAENHNLPTLEASLAEITTLVDSMEKSELSLDQSLSHFERGVSLVKHCQTILSAAEQKIQLLIQANHEDRLTPYQEDTSSGNHDKP